MVLFSGPVSNWTITSVLGASAPEKFTRVLIDMKSLGL